MKEICKRLSRKSNKKCSRSIKRVTSFANSKFYAFLFTLPKVAGISAAVVAGLCPQNVTHMLKNKYTQLISFSAFA